MSKCILFVIGMLSLQVHAFRAEEHREYYEMEAPEIREIAELSPVPFTPFDESCEMNLLLSPAAISWDEIVNIGSQVWKIIVDNQPVLHSTAPVAHALPRGLGCWTDLEQWSAPVTKTYEVVYKNKFGIEVVKFRFRLQYTAGGRNNGRGRYLSNVTVLNGQTDVIWGYTFNSRVEVAKAVNLGSRRDPVAGLELNLHWNVKTVVKESDNSVHFFVDGNGGLRMAE